MKTETAHTPKPRKPRFWIGCFILLLSSPILFYYGYCWGLWGRHSLLLQYLFQCSCPPVSEEARYPRQVDVVVSACQQSRVELSPSGRLLYVQQEEEFGITSIYLLNLDTDKKTSFAPPAGSNYFLNDELIFHSLYGDDESIWDIKTDKKYPIQRFAKLRFDAYVNGELNLNLLAEVLHEMSNVFLIEDDTIVALVKDFPNHPERNFIVRRGDFPYGEANPAEQFLQQYDIVYQKPPPRFSIEMISLDGKLVARVDGIYSVKTGQRVVGRISSLKGWAIRGWTYDGSAVIYSYFYSNPCVIRIGFMDGTVCYLAVPQPVLKLKVPEKYLLPAKTP